MRASSRLHAEWQRLYAADPGAPNTLIDAHGRTRTLVMALARPAKWAPLSAVWQTVQTEAALPAPGIAVSGSDSFQLWFSLAEAVPVAEAHAFLEALRRHCLGDIGAARVTLWPSLPSLDGAPVSHGDQHGPQQGTQHAPAIPARRGNTEQWSAFVAPDLAPMFDDAPWLDLPPSPEGQAELLSRLRSIPPMAWQAARTWVQQAATAAPPTAPAPSAIPTGLPGTASPHTDLAPHAFLRQVMNDATVPLALRIEAAKALLPHGPHTPPAT